MHIFASSKRRSQRSSSGEPSSHKNGSSSPQAGPEASTVRGLWSDQLGRLATRCVQIIALVIVVALVVFVMTQISLALIPVVIALILASAVHPLISWMRHHGIRPVFAALISMLTLLGTLGGLAWLVVWAVENQWDELVASADDGIDQLQGFVQDLPFAITSEQIEEVKQAGADFITSSQFGNSALAGVSATVSFFTGLVLMVVLLFFFLKDGPKLWEFLLRPFTGEKYERGRRVGDKTVETLGGYVRGTATIAAADSIGIGIGLFFIGVPLVLPLMVIVFLTSFIPLVGATLAGVLAALVALVSNGPVAALLVLAVVILVNQIEGNFLQPVVMARSLNLHALVVLLALTIGTILGGVVGAVLAVPITAVAWGIVTVWNGPHEPAKPAKPKPHRPTD